MKEEKTINIMFVGIDSWNRPVFKHTKYSFYFGSVAILFPDKEKAPNNTPGEISEFFRKNIGELEYFGEHFDCEPHGGLPKHIKLNITTPYNE
jgi:hypothetical protein